MAWCVAWSEAGIEAWSVAGSVAGIEAGSEAGIEAGERGGERGGGECARRHRVERVGGRLIVRVERVGGRLIVRVERVGGRLNVMKRVGGWHRRVELWRQSLAQRLAGVRVVRRRRLVQQHRGDEGQPGVHAGGGGRLLLHRLGERGGERGGERSGVCGYVGRRLQLHLLRRRRLGLRCGQGA